MLAGKLEYFVYTSQFTNIFTCENHYFRLAFNQLIIIVILAISLLVIFLARKTIFMFAVQPSKRSGTEVVPTKTNETFFASLQHANNSKRQPKLKKINVS